jgi:hypothetical protein
MASLLGEGGIAALSGTCSSSSPAVLADFSPDSGNGIGAGADGRPCNIYVVQHSDTQSTLAVMVQVAGINTTNSTAGTGTKALPIFSGGGYQAFQMTEHHDHILKVSAWLENATGGALTGSATSSSVFVAGGVCSRRI